jgi:glycosyltransferase involved in cell wall biosynthesis
MRILHVLPGLAPGGMEQVVIQLAEDAAQHGDSVVVASGPGAWVDRVGQIGAAYVALPATSRGAAPGMAVAAARLAHCIRRLRPHIVHTHNVRATALARLALAAAHHRAILVPTLHGLAPGAYGPASRILRLAAPRVITCTPSVARSLQAAGFPPARIDIISNGASLSAASTERQQELRQVLRLGSGPLVVGIGRLVRQKNWPVFIAAAGMLAEPAFVVAGEGPSRDQLVRLARESGDRVRFLGRVDDIAALVGLATCVVSTSSWEGLPLTILEALSLGTPVVATAVDGVKDVIPARAALLVAPDDPAEVSTAIARIITDEELATSLRQRALAAARSWRPEEMLVRYRIAYRAALAGPCAVS